MTSVHFILASLRHHWRMHVAVGLGVAVATAVLTGALLVGDSVRGSLRDLTLQRLGRIDSALVTDHFFRAALAEEVHGEPAILMPGTLEAGGGDNLRRATQVSIVGVRDAFWKLGEGGPKEPLVAESVAITEPLARELGVATGDTILLRIPAAKAIPADSSLGKKDDTSIGRRLRVAVVLPAEGLARFALQPSQQLPRNVFVPLATLQSMLDKAGRANAILVAGKVQEYLAPLFPEFISQFNPKDARFLGTPLDFIVFDGLDEGGEVKRVVFVEIKTGRAGLVSRERRCRDAIEAGRVEYQLLRLPGEDAPVEQKPPDLTIEELDGSTP